MGRVRLLLSAALVVCLPSASLAQSSTDAGTFAGLQGVLKPRQQIVVTDIGGGRTRGDVISVDEELLTLRVADGFGHQSTRTFRQPSVASIRRSDRLWNGILIGMGAGFAAAEIWRYQLCGTRNMDDECAAIAAGVGLVSFVPGGAVVGALVDKAMGNHLVYRSDRRATLQLAPVVTPMRQAIAATIRF
jgi:hypothetical protein